ncbi:unnamed protein product [Periconia digitata]|uniref:Uncharacterized protein n=1 Tax=Periconia digitata TaxID=1303443 RepID=A0A9W4UL83_9PLEO|nr:unnamed protein product [Periconia digitata]
MNAPQDHIEHIPRPSVLVWWTFHRWALGFVSIKDAPVHGLVDTRTFYGCHSTCRSSALWSFSVDTTRYPLPTDSEIA